LKNTRPQIALYNQPSQFSNTQTLPTQSIHYTHQTIHNTNQAT